MDANIDGSSGGGREATGGRGGAASGRGRRGSTAERKECAGTGRRGGTEGQAGAAAADEKETEEARSGAEAAGCVAAGASGTKRGGHTGTEDTTGRTELETTEARRVTASWSAETWRWRERREGEDASGGAEADEVCAVETAHTGTDAADQLTDDGQTDGARLAECNGRKRRRSGQEVEVGQREVEDEVIIPIPPSPVAPVVEKSEPSGSSESIVP